MANDSEIIKCSAHVHSAKIGAEGNIKLKVVIPSLYIGTAVSILKTIGQTCTLGIVCEKQKYIISNVSYAGLKFDAEGEAKVDFEINPETSGSTLTDVLAWRGKDLKLAIKIG